MKVTPRFMVRAALVATAAGVIGAFGACKDSNEPTPPPVPPPPGITAPSGLTATAASGTRVDLGWTDNSTNETGFKVERCSGAGCTNFAQIGTNTAANITTFADTVGLTASTQYSYRVAAFNATETSTFATATATTLGVTPPANQFTMVGAGEITTCNSGPAPQATAALVKGILDADTSAIAFTVGNNLADAAAGTTYECFDRNKWGELKPRMRVALGNGDYEGGRGATAVYNYFGTSTGPAGKGWYWFEKGNWRIVVLNTSDYEHGSLATFGVTRDAANNEVQVPSEQADWLAATLAENTKPCVAVISWERRFYTSSTAPFLGRQFNMVRMGGIMQQHGVDLLISAKDKLYARFAKANNRSGNPDPAGYRQFIVGTGGRTPDNEIATGPTIREAQIADQWGVLKLTMGENSYSWEFLNTTPGGASDSGGPVPCN